MPQLAPPETIADYIAISWESSQNLVRPVLYWDTHVLGIQRYYASLCLLYGRAPRSYPALAEYIPDARRAGCRAEYQIAEQGYQWLEAIRYEYGPVRSQVQQKMLGEIRSLNLIENTVGAVDQFFGFSRPLNVKMQRCGKPQASWQPLSRELIIYHEMLDAFSRVYVMREANKKNSE